MSENSGVPYVLQLKDGVNAIHLSENVTNIGSLSLAKSTNITFVPSYDPGIEQVCIQPVPQIIQKAADATMEVEAQNVTNEQGNFIYEVVYPEQLNLKPPVCTTLKRGRPKKKKVEDVPPADVPKVVKPAPRTRSGRVVKFPKHMEKDFKKVEVEDDAFDNEHSEVKTSEFIRFVEDVSEIKKHDEIQLEFHQRRRTISGQYRCPKCTKVYLGKTKMIQHIRKNPDHGPLPQNELNFDVWNYLVDITQKCPPAQRGVKFCEELTNLLHNVLLLTSALFKKAEVDTNHVDIDKVLGNAIGLPPGPYKFNDNELYKDVTVLKLITNSNFFKPISEGFDVKTSNKEAKDVEHKTNSLKQESLKNEGVVKESMQVACFPIRNAHVVFESTSAVASANYKITAESSPTPNFTKKKVLDDRLPVHSDLLSDNSILNLPTLRTSVDELILSGVDSGTNLLDTSTSSDEVMNVDQFVNERFKKITEPEIEMSTTALNLDLPSLDLFQFHTS